MGEKTRQNEKYVSWLRELLLPEDSSATRVMASISLPVWMFKVKALFWSMVAIGAAILIARLH